MILEMTQIRKNNHKRMHIWMDDIKEKVYTNIDDMNDIMANQVHLISMLVLTN